MKVLFAVGSDQLSKNIADKYYEKYGEVLEYKNVFFFKALIEEVKRDKTYDRIIINEEFEQFRATDLEQIDRTIFNYIDKVTDELQDAEIILICANRRNPGDSFVNKLFSIGIYNMLIGNDRNMNPLCDIIKRPRSKREAKEYLHIDTSIISNAAITKDNEVEEQQLKSILAYFDGIKNQPEKFLETFDRVAEQYSMTQLRIIVEYLPKVVKDEVFKADRYKYLMPQTNTLQPVNRTVETVSQATAKIEPPKKRGLFGFKKSKVEPVPKGGALDMSQMQSSGRVDLSSNVEEQKRQQINSQGNAKIEIDINNQAELEARAKAEAKAREQAMLAEKARAETKAREQAELEAKARAEAKAREQAELEAKARAEAKAREQAELEAKARAEAKAREQAELEAKARAEVKAREQAMLAEKARAEAKAREQAELEAKARAEAKAREQADLEAKAKAETKAREQAMLAEKARAEAKAREQAELEAKAKAEAKAREQATLVEKARAEANARMNAGFNSNVLNANIDVHQNQGDLVEVRPNPNAPDRTVKKPEIPIITPNMNQQTPIDIVNNVETTNVLRNPEVLEQEKKMKEEQEKLAIEQKKIREAQERLEEEKRKLREEQERFVSAQTQLRNEINTSTSAPQYVNTLRTMQTNPLPNLKKMVVFVGANKVGTTFVTNAVAHNIASSKVLTSVIDMTRDKSMYYIYADESKALKNRAAECMQRLSDGEDHYIETMNSYLKLYTTVAGSISDQRRGYKHKTIIETVKRNCNLTIVDADFTTPIDYFDQADEIYLVQDLDILKIQDVTLFLREINARGLDKKKIKLIINKYVKTSISPKIIIGALDFYHDPGGTYVDSGLMPAKVDYSLIPYNLNNYAKYVESLHKMSGSFNYKNYSTDFNQAIDEIVAKVYPRNPVTKKRFFG